MVHVDPRKSSRRTAVSSGEASGASGGLFSADGGGFDKVALSSSMAHVSQRQTSPTSPRRRTHAHAQSMSVSRSQDGYIRSSPSRDRSQSRSDGSNADGRESPPLTVPLLLPPPTSYASEVWRAIQVRWINFCGRSDWPAEFSLFLFRLCLFICKLATLVWPCLPYMVRLEVGIPVALLAGLDLGMPSVGRSSQTLRARSGDTAGDRVVAGNSRLGGVRGVKLSLTLLGLHVLTVWVASRRGMCAVGHGA